MCQCVCVICSPAAQSSVIELLEESGLPPICVAIADASNADVTLGKVLVAAVKVRTPPADVKLPKIGGCGECHGRSCIKLPDLHSRLDNSV